MMRGSSAAACQEAGRLEGCLELDEVWLTRAETKRRSEVSERTLTVEQRQQFIEAKVEELTSYFKKAVWTFAEPGAHGTGRVLPGGC